MILKVGFQNKNEAKSLKAKTWMIMKLTIALLLFFTFQVNAKTNAQRITIVKDNIHLSDVFKSIERQTGYLFFYDKSLINNTDPIDVSIRNATLVQALSDCLKGRQLTYSIVRNTIVIQPLKSDALQIQNPLMMPEPPPPVDLHGRVVNKNGEPLENVSVIIAGTKSGTTTDKDGRFTLSVPDNRNIELEISSVGYQTKKVKVEGQTEINITLELEVTGLSDVVVVGYGTQKKSDLTGAITTLKSDDFSKGVSSSVDDLLRGKAAGVQVVQNSSEPGGGVSISIRGASSINAGTGPLYVIDGLPIDNSPAISGSGIEVATRSPRNPLSSINPADIASIEVLKDASAAAIYGSRGANGVILITTKKGRNGAMKINYNGYAGTQSIANTIDLLTPQQYQTVLNELITEGAAPADNKVNTLVEWRNGLAIADFSKRCSCSKPQSFI